MRFLAGFMALILLLWAGFSDGLIAETIQWLLFTLLVFIWGFFSFSLLPNKTPIITRYAYLIDQQLSNQELIYTRLITIIWSVYLLLVILTKLFPEMLLSQTSEKIPVWIGLYVFGGLLFPAEFYTRKLLFKRHRSRSFGAFIKQLMQIPLTQIWHFEKPVN